MRYLFILLLAGCAATRGVQIDYSKAPPDDWPRLQERVQRVTQEQIGKLCGLPEDIADHYSGCARPLFDKRLCLIYVTDDAPEILEHERAHCRGYDHVGATRLTGRQAWESYKAMQRDSAPEWRKAGGTYRQMEADLRRCEINLQPEVCMRNLGYERR